MKATAFTAGAVGFMALKWSFRSLDWIGHNRNSLLEANTKEAGSHSTTISLRLPGHNRAAMTSILHTAQATVKTNSLGFFQQNKQAKYIKSKYFEPKMEGSNENQSMLCWWLNPVKGDSWKRLTHKQVYIAYGINVDAKISKQWLAGFRP